MDMYDLLLAKSLGGGGGGGVTVEELNVTQNGDYSEDGKAYSPVHVNVSGGGSVEIETGTWTPTSDTNGTLKVNFTDTHDTTPTIVMLTDTEATDHTYAGRWFLYLDNERLAQMGGTDLITLSSDGTSKLYGIARSVYNTSNNNGSQAGRLIKKISGSAGDDEIRDTYVSTAWFCPFTYQNSSPFKSGRSYKWVAIWL